ncbi:MAG: hypothetical protein FWE37_05715 [Spirochaetaceae bacterium]|nr:hypothetical protein [Spirochaetaceae bacterium]
MEKEQELEELGLIEEDFEATKWNLADDLDSQEEVLANIKFALEQNDFNFLIAILEALPRSKAASVFNLSHNDKATTNSLLSKLGIQIKLENVNAVAIS